MGLKQKVCCYTLKFLKKQQIKIIGIGGVLAMFGFFTISFALMRSQTPSYQFINKPVSIGEFNGLSVDSEENIYIGGGDNRSVQVFNESGEFLYGFYVGTSFCDAFDIDSQDRLHIIGGKGSKHEVFYGGELESSKIISSEQKKELKKSYRSSRSKVFNTDNKIYKYSFLNKIVVTNINNNEKSIIRLPIPLWPWPIYMDFMPLGLGLALFYSGTMGIYKLEEILQIKSYTR